MTSPRPTTRCTCPEPDYPLLTVNGVRFALLTPRALLGRIARMTACPLSHIVNPLDSYSTVVARKDPDVLRALNAADLNVADGMGVVWACRLMTRQRDVCQLPGPDLLRTVPRLGVSLGIRHAVVGANWTTLRRLRERIIEDAPGVRVIGAYAPPFRAIYPEGVAEDLSHLPELPDIIWVGLGTPKQQLWAHLATGLVSGVTFITVGAAFDYVAGIKRQAPRVFRRASLEWAYNAMTQPRRRGYREIVGNAIFSWQVRDDVVRGIRSSSDPIGGRSRHEAGAPEKGHLRT